MIEMTPREWAATNDLTYPPGSKPLAVKLTASQWFVRHGLWIALLLIVTTWEVLGFIFPVARAVPEWWDHPTISAEIKALIGTSLSGRVITSVVIAALSALLTLHWAWGVM